MTRDETTKLAKEIAQEEAKKAIAAAKDKTYDTVEAVPEWGRPTVKKLVNKGALKGDLSGKLGLDENTIRILVINDRSGLYGA